MPIPGTRTRPRGVTLATDRGPTRSKKRAVAVRSLIGVCAAVGVLIAIALIVSAQAVPKRASIPRDSDAVLQVNHVPVPFREFDIFLKSNRAATYSEFSPRVTVSDSAAFWNTPIDKTTPSLDLMKRATRDAVKTSIQFQLAKKYDLVASAEYGTFVLAWQAENLRRQQALRAGKPIYGPQQYTESNYLTYATGDLAAQLQEALVKDGTIDASAASVKNYYDAHRGDFASPASQGPVTDDYKSVQKQVRLHLIDASYSRLVDRLVASTALSKTSHYRSIEDSGCLASGRC